MRRRSHAHSPRRSSVAPIRAAALIASVAFSFVGCRQILGDNFVLESDAGLFSSANCAETGYPSRPPAGQSLDQIEFVVALRTDSYGDDKGPYKNLGFNLDQTCTRSVGPTSCREPVWATADHQDGPGGVDNASANILAGLNQGPAFANYDTLTENTGARAYLVRVRGYNGLADDDTVEVSFFSASTNPPPAPTVTPGMPTPPVITPQWKGKDVWLVGGDWVDGDSVDSPKYVDHAAYVTGGALVAQFDTLQTGYPFGGYETLDKVVLKADILVANGEHELANAVLAARWGLRSILGFTSLATKRYPDCRDPREVPNDFNYWQALDKVCQYVDIRVEGDDPAASCDGISFAQAMHGVPAVLGDVFQGASDPPCPAIFGPALCEIVSQPSDASTAFDGGSSLLDASSVPDAHD